MGMESLCRGLLEIMMVNNNRADTMSRSDSVRHE